MKFIELPNGARIRKDAIVAAFPVNLSERLPLPWQVKMVFSKDSGTHESLTSFDTREERDAFLTRIAAELEDAGEGDNRTAEAITAAHHATCTCGGAGPGKGCPACEMWHALTYPPPCFTL